MNLVIIAGSARTASLSSRVATYLAQYFSTEFPTHTTTLVDVRKYELPFVQKPFTSLETTPTAWQPLAECMFGADAFILVSPEYNGGYSPAMKNLLDHFPSFPRKPFGIVTSSPGALGGMRAAQHMQQLVTGFGGILCPTMLIVPMVDKKFSETNELLDDTFTKTITRFTSEFMWLAETITTK